MNKDATWIYKKLENGHECGRDRGIESLFYFERLEVKGREVGVEGKSLWCRRSLS